MFRNLRRGAAADGPPATGFTCFFLHHAGGSSAAFTHFADLFPAHWRLLAADLPGRGVSAGRPLCRSTDEVVDALLPAFLEQARGPFAVFGHSMGGLVGYELVRALEHHRRPPAWLGVSAMVAPRQVTSRFAGRRDLWSQDRLISFVKDLGGTPAEMLDDPDILEYLVEILREDLAVVDTYVFREGPPLDTPLSVFHGLADLTTKDQTIADWRPYAAGPSDIHAYPGGHFYLFDQPEEVAGRITTDIGRALARGAR